MYLLIGKSNCSHCSDVRACLNEKNIPYTYLDQTYTHADILNHCADSGCMFYPFVLKVIPSTNIDDLIKSISS